MNEEQLKKFESKISEVEKQLIDARASGSAKSEVIRRLDSDLRVAKEIAILAQRDPKMIESLVKSFEKIAEKKFMMPDSMKIENIGIVEKLLKQILEKEQPVQDSVIVSNLEEIRPPKEVGVVGLNYLIKGLHNGFLGVLEGIKELGSKVFKANITGTVKVTNKELEDAIPVRLASSDLRYFYNAMVSVMGSGGDSQDTTILKQILAALGTIGGGGATVVGDGTQTLTTAGTSEQLPNVACRKVIIQAHESNNGTIVVGGSNVVAALAGRRGYALFPTQAQAFEVSNINLLYIDGTSSTDKIHYFYEA
jgi:hypothetical protein